MKRSVLFLCFLLALTLSSLCARKISPVYASSEEIINGGFEDGELWTEWEHYYTSMYEGGHNSSEYCAFIAEDPDYSYYGWINQTLSTSVIVSSIESFTWWYKVDVEDYYNITIGYSDSSNSSDIEYATSLTWTQIDYTVNITLGKSITSIQFAMCGNTTHGVYIDDVSLMKLDSIPVSLDIQGDPEINYDFEINGSAYTTPYNNPSFTSGNITLENSDPSLTVGHFIYTFSYWSINATTNLTSSSLTLDIGGNTTISLVFSKAILDIAFDPRNVASEIVHLADTGSQLGKMLGVNSFIGGLIMSAIICGIFLFPVMIFKRTLLPMAIMGFLGLAISTGLGFLPFWIDLVLLLIISVLFSGKIRDFITGAGH